MHGDGRDARARYAAHAENVSLVSFVVLLVNVLPSGRELDIDR